MNEDKIKIPVTNQEIKNEIFSLFCKKASRINCASVVINRDELPFVPHIDYNIQNFVNDELKNEARKKGFEFSVDKSDDFQLVFFMK